MNALHLLFRNLRLCLLTTVLCAAASSAFGKSAEDYFHDGAYKYVAGKHQEALIGVEEGLRQYPNDTHLQKLAEQLRKMKDQQNPSNGKGDDKKKDQKGKNDPNKDKKDGDKKPDENKDKDKKDGDKKPDENKDDGKNNKDGKNPPGAPPPGQMSEDEAKRLLNSFADDEKKEQRERQKVLRKRLETGQDW